MESSIKMKLYALTKRQFVLVFVVFFTCFGACAIFGLAGPSVITSHVQSAKSLSVFNKSSTIYQNQQMSQSKGPRRMTDGFRIDSGSLSTFSQQLWLTGSPKLKGIKEGNSLVHTFSISVQIMYQALDNSYRPLTSELFNHSRTVTCYESGCDEFVIFHLGYLDYRSYKAIVYITNLDSLPKGVIVDDVDFTFSHFNVAFTEVEIWFRFVFIVLTFMVTSIYANSLRRFPFRDWSIEQKWMSILLPLLLLFNDPIFPLHFLVRSWVTGMFESLFRASFLAAILLFWLCAFHGIRLSERHFFSFYLTKILIVGLIGISAFTLTTWQQFNELRDPSYQSKLDIKNFTGFKIFFFIVVSIYILCLIFLVAKAFTEIRGLPYFDIRLKFLTALMLIVLIVSIVFMMLRYGRTALHNNFIAELQTTYKNTAEFLTFYGLLNFYLYTMAFVYAPARNALYDSFFKDNPSMSMINDSEDEVIYGKGEGKRPLSSDDDK